MGGFESLFNKIAGNGSESSESREDKETLLKSKIANLEKVLEGLRNDLEEAGDSEQAELLRTRIRRTEQEIEELREELEQGRSENLQQAA